MLLLCSVWYRKILTEASINSGAVATPSSDLPKGIRLRRGSPQGLFSDGT